MPIFLTDTGPTRRTITGAYVTDAGGTRRQIIAIHVTDSGGTRRTIYLDQIDISNQNVLDLRVLPNNARAGIHLDANGTWARIQSTLTTPIGNWVTPTSRASAYEVRATLNSGSVDGTSAATGTWLAMTADRRWTVTRTTIGTSTANLTLEIRRASDGTVMDSATISLTAELET